MQELCAQLCRKLHALSVDSTQFGRLIIAIMKKNKFSTHSNTEQRVQQFSGKHLKLFRILAGLRQYEVAARIGITATKLCEIEAGRQDASPELIARILDALKVGQDATSR